MHFFDSLTRFFDELTLPPPGQPCFIERDIAELVAREFSVAARLDRARRNHRARGHLLRYQRLAKAIEVAA
jgi:hypothetical protein